MCLAQDALHAGKQLVEVVLRLEDFLMVGPVEIVGERGARYLDHDRLGVAEADAEFARLDLEGGVVAGRARQKEFVGVKTAEIFVGRRGLRLARILGEGVEVEGQQHRHGAFVDAGKTLLAQFIEPAKGLGRRSARFGQARRRGIPVDRAQGDGGTLHFARHGRRRSEQSKATEKTGSTHAFQVRSLVLPVQPSAWSQTVGTLKNHRPAAYKGGAFLVGCGAWPPGPGPEESTQ